MATSPGRRLLYGLADAGASVYGQFRSKRSAFLSHERTPIAGARMGELVKVVGRLRGNGWEYKAPLSATPCLWYRAAVKNLESLPSFLVLAGGYFSILDILKTSVARFTDGKAIAEEESVDLFLDDESGSAVVDARSAHFSLVSMRSGWTLAAPDVGRGAAAGRFLERYAVTPNGQLMYREVFLKEGDTVAVLGRPRTELDPTARGDFRTPPTRIVFDEPGQLLVSNEPGVF